LVASRVQGILDQICLKAIVLFCIENIAKRHRTRSSRDKESRLARSSYHYCFSVHTRSLWEWRRRALAYNEEAYWLPKGRQTKGNKKLQYQYTLPTMYRFSLQDLYTGISGMRVSMKRKLSSLENFPFICSRRTSA
jgi:hypothetical protein